MTLSAVLKMSKIVKQEKLTQLISKQSPKNKKTHDPDKL